MSQHVVHLGLKKRPEQKIKRYNVLEVTEPDGYPSLGRVVRHFTSARRHSSAEEEAFIEAFDRDCFDETTSGRHYSLDFSHFPHTLRHARKAFWKLVAIKQEAIAKSLLLRCFSFLEVCRWELGDRNELALARVNACFDELVRFMLQRFVLDDMGYKNFGASMLKHLLKRAQEASDEVTELVYVTVLEKKLLWYNQIASYRQISIDQTEWAALQQVLFFLVEDVGKPLLSKKVKGLIGQLLAVLQTSRFDNPDYLYESRRGKKTLAMGAYQASVRYTLFELRKWLDGKEPGKELRLAA